MGGKDWKVSSLLELRIKLMEKVRRKLTWTCGSCVPSRLVGRFENACIRKQRYNTKSKSSTPERTRIDKQLWDLKTFKIRIDLPGHTDEVYCVDFVADKVVSGGRDKTVKM